MYRAGSAGAAGLSPCLVRGRQPPQPCHLGLCHGNRCILFELENAQAAHALALDGHLGLPPLAGAGTHPPIGRATRWCGPRSARGPSCLLSLAATLNIHSVQTRPRSGSSCVLPTAFFVIAVHQHCLLPSLFPALLGAPRRPLASCFTHHPLQLPRHALTDGCCGSAAGAGPLVR